MTRRLVNHSVRALARYRLRTTFMMVGSLVGAAALTFVVLIGQAVERKMLTTVRQIFGDSSVLVMAGGHQLMGGPRPDAARLTLDDIEAVATAVPGIEAWDPQQVISAAVRRGHSSATARVVGQSERSARVWSRPAVRGAYFDAAAVRRSDRVAVIGETVARDLFGTADPLDGEILIESVAFRVIGVLERFGTDLHGMDRDNEIVVPISTLMRRLMNVDTIAAAKLLVRDPGRLETTAGEIRRELRARHALAVGQPDDFNLVTPIEVRRMVGTVQRTLSLYMPLAAGVALLVGGIVAATLMLSSVAARVGEIGLRRAVGARPGDIGMQFLIETAVTMVGGGAAGAVLGLAAAQVVASRLQMTTGFSWNAVILALASSALTGLLAGVLPARRASRLHPAEALR